MTKIVSEYKIMDWEEKITVQSDSHPDPVRNTTIKPKVPLNGLSFFVSQRRLAPIMADIAIDTLKIFTMSGSRVVHCVAAQIGLFLKSID